MSISNAIRKLTTSEDWTVVNDSDITTLEWRDSVEDAPTTAAIEAEVAKQATEALVTKYKNDRVNGKYETIIEDEDIGPIGRTLVSEGYPSIGDQLDALFHAGVFPDDMAAQIQAVKDANPKPVA
jgi:hypothetical protein